MAQRRPRLGAAAPTSMPMALTQCSLTIRLSRLGSPASRLGMSGHVLASERLAHEDRRVGPFSVAVQSFV